MYVVDMRDTETIGGEFDTHTSIALWQKNSGPELDFSPEKRDGLLIKLQLEVLLTFFAWHLENT